MSHRPHRFRLQIPRVALLALIALGVIAQSMIATMGDLHESVLHAKAGETYTHQHAGHTHDALQATASHAHHTAGEHGEDEAGSNEIPASLVEGALHLLQHQYCGGHCAWIDGNSLFTAQLSVMATMLPADNARQVIAADYTAPFRPPISA